MPPGVVPGVGDAVADGVGLAEAEGVVTTVGKTGDGAAGSAWTAEPALIALPTSATITPMTTTTATSTATRRTQ